MSKKTLVRKSPTKDSIVKKIPSMKVKTFQYRKVHLLSYLLRKLFYIYQYIFTDGRENFLTIVIFCSSIVTKPQHGFLLF